MSASMCRARDGARQAGGRGRAKFGEQSREVTVDVLKRARVAQVRKQCILVHPVAPLKHASIASMQARVGASRYTPRPGISGDMPRTKR